MARHVPDEERLEAEMTSRLAQIIPIACVAVLSACQPDVPSITSLDAEEYWLQPDNEQVDILFVVDNSGTMAKEQRLLAEGFAAFADELDLADADFHLGVVTTDVDSEGAAHGALVGSPPFLTPEDDYVSLFQERVQLGTDGSIRERGFEAGHLALTPKLTKGANEGFARPNADLFVVFVSDEDDCSDDGAIASGSQNDCYTRADELVSIGEYVHRYHALKPPGTEFRASAIVVPDGVTSFSDCANRSNKEPGNRYIAMAEATGGVVGNTCDPDWSFNLQSVADRALDPRDSFLLEQEAEPTSLQVWVDDELVPEDTANGWSYDAIARMLHFHGDTVPPRGSEIAVRYTPLR
jgi:hypothetical protein